MEDFSFLPSMCGGHARREKLRELLGVWGGVGGEGYIRREHKYEEERIELHRKLGGNDT